MVLGYAATRGTGPGAVFYAMYPFRLRAAARIAGRADPADLGRLLHLVGAGLLSGAPVVLGALLVLVLRRRSLGGSGAPATRPLSGPLSGAVLALAGYDVASIALGGNYWLHYLLQLVVPAALAVGLLVEEAPRPAVRLVSAMVAVALVGWGVGLLGSSETPGGDVGRALAAVSVPGDTVVAALGSGDTEAAAGLASPYPYLWSLPSRVLDPRMSRLAATLAGHRAPTWLVVRGPGTFTELQDHGIASVLRRHYRPVGEVCGRTVYLRLDVTRPTPVAPQDCRAPNAGWLHEVTDLGEAR